MAETHGLGRAFWHPIRINTSSPRIHRATTNEVDEPYRQSKSLVVRLFGERAVTFGWWKDTDREEEDALMDAVSGSSLGFFVPEFEPYDE